MIRLHRYAGRLWSALAAKANAMATSRLKAKHDLIQQNTNNLNDELLKMFLLLNNEIKNFWGMKYTNTVTLIYHLIHSMLLKLQYFYTTVKQLS